MFLVRGVVDVMDPDFLMVDEIPAPTRRAINSVAMNSQDAA